MLDDGKTLWTTLGGERFFLIPDGEELPASVSAKDAPEAVELRDAFGRRLTVDGARLPPFEVPAEQAGARVLAQLREGLGISTRPMQVWSQDADGTPRVDLKISTSPAALRDGLAALWSGLKPSLLQAVSHLPRSVVSDGPRAAFQTIAERMRDILTSPQLQQTLKVVASELQSEVRAVRAHVERTQVERSEPQDDIPEIGATVRSDGDKLPN